MEIDELRNFYLGQPHSGLLSSKIKNIFETILKPNEEIEEDYNLIGKKQADLKFLSLAISDTFDVLKNHNAADVLKWIINTLHEEALCIQI